MTTPTPTPTPSPTPTPTPNPHQNDKHVDYAIPANSKSLRFQHTLSQMLVRSINEGRTLRDELEGFALKRPTESSDGWGDRGGGGGGGRGGGGGGRRQGGGGRR